LVRNDLTLSGLTGGNAVEGTAVSVALVNGTGVHNLSYQWLEWNAGTSSWQNVANATTASFTPGEGDEGKQLANVGGESISSKRVTGKVGIENLGSQRPEPTQSAAGGSTD
jgi:hypothetical protein